MDYSVKGRPLTLGQLAEFVDTLGHLGLPDDTPLRAQTAIEIRLDGTPPPLLRLVADPDAAPSASTPRIQCGRCPQKMDAALLLTHLEVVHGINPQQVAAASVMADLRGEPGTEL